MSVRVRVRVRVRARFYIVSCYYLQCFTLDYLPVFVIMR
jgi:hypothetical protein